MSAPHRKDLDSPVQFLKGIGPELAKTLAKLNLNTVNDLLHHFPRRFEDRTHLPELRTVRAGQFATIKGRLSRLDARQIGRGRVIIRALLTDGKSGIYLVWFNQPWVKRRLERYRGEVIAYGMVKEGQNALEMHSPEYELLDEDDSGEDFARITPIYPLTEGVLQWLVRKAVNSALLHFLEAVEDPLPEKILHHYELKTLKWSLAQIHQPNSEAHRLEARRRLVFDEFLAIQLAMQMRRAQQQLEPGNAFQIPTDMSARIEQLLPFKLTGAQDRVVQEILADMSEPAPMNRLLQGDVGSGKTAVAACALMACVADGFQGALMAPTEILAEQHYQNLRALFSKSGLEVAMLVGKHTAKQKEKIYADVASGKSQIVIGTHALIQEGVTFAKLGLIIVDEQHRFGVMQRAALRDKGFGNPDLLVMTATPIPRTLTMAVYGDLELSVIDELPPGRQAIKTHWRTQGDRQKVYDGVRKLVAEGRQVYFVCPMVSESEKMLAQAAEELHRRLSTMIFTELRVGLLHGQMKSKDKEAAMEAFRRHDLDILVSTTVIEVGVDVPNASVMVIEDANRFGLSQLHQLRGRVGRGEQQSFSILIADPTNEEAIARMEIMVKTTDGFEIAEEDLRLRGPGELAGTRQHGNLDFKLADLVQDGKMLEVARQAAIKLIKYDPDLSRPEHRLLAAVVRERAAAMSSLPVA
ncbi:MAG: ATP-dependent DNA helicase RecG [Fimbriimonadaceae bacterium]